MAEVSPMRVILTGSAALVVGGALAVGVSAHTSHHNSSLNINAFTNGSANNYVYGAVTSPSGKCAAGRKVRVFRKQPDDDQKLGSDVSHESGSGSGPYTVIAPTGDLPQGTYYSEIRKRDTKPGGRHDHICRGAKSPELAVGP